MRDQTHFDVLSTVAALDAAKRQHLEAVLRELPFSAAKGLIHRICDDIATPRAFVKCMPTGVSSWYATQQHEIFLNDPSSCDAAICGASALLLQSDGAAVETDEHEIDVRLFENYLHLTSRYASVRPAALAGYSAAVSTIFDREMTPQLHLGNARSSWADVKPGDRLYDKALGSGCRIYKRFGEPEPRRDVV